MTVPQKFGLFRHADRTKTFAAGSTIFAAGDSGLAMYAIKSGQVAIVIDGTTVNTLGPEEVFGEMALLEHLPRLANAVAIQESEIVEVDETEFLFLVRQNPFFALQMMKLLSARLRSADALYKTAKG